MSMRFSLRTTLLSITFYAFVLGFIAFWRKYPDVAAATMFVCSVALLFLVSALLNSRADNQKTDSDESRAAINAKQVIGVAIDTVTFGLGGLVHFGESRGSQDAKEDYSGWLIVVIVVGLVVVAVLLGLMAA